MALVSSKNLVPPQVVEHLLGVSPKELEDKQPLGPLILLVRPPEDEAEPEFLPDLVKSILAGARTVPEVGAWLTTSEFPALSSRPSDDPVEVDLVELIAELGQAVHAVVPLLFPQDSGELVVGRSSEADIRLNHPGVSAKHASLVRQGPSVKLRDLGSKNGTRINDSQLEAGDERWVQPMDRVSFGRVDGFICDPRALRAVLLQGLHPVRLG